MSIPRYTNSFENGAGQTIDYVGCLFDNDALFITHDYPAVDNTEHTTISYTMDQQIDATSIPFYFNLDKCVSFEDWICADVASDIDEFAAPLTHAIIMAASQGRHDYSISSLDFPELQSKKQGQFGNDGVYQYLFLTATIGRNELHEQDKFCEITIYVRTARGRWDETNEVWTMPYGDRILAFGYTNGGAPVVDGGTNMLHGMRNFNYCVGPTMGRTLVGNQWRWSITNPDDTWIYAYEIGIAAYINNYNMSHVIGTLNYWNDHDWINEGGDVEPVDPGREPEPYPPTPPKPPTPDPPQPIDPVDPVPIPDDPPIGEVGAGFVTVYNPDGTDLRQLAAKFWDQTVWDMLKQHFTNPFDAIFSLSMIPVTPDKTSGVPLVIGNYNTHIETNRVTSEYATLNCGSVYIPKFFNSYLDYDPYTKYKLFLPFIGEVDLNADEITSKTINITYKVNVISGDCVALLIIDNSVFAQFNGNCARQISITKGNLESILQNSVQFAATAAGALATFGAASGMAGAITESGVTASGELSKSANIRLAGVEAHMSSMNANTLSAGVNSVMGSKVSYSKAGRPGQGSGQISVRVPFITITRPNLTLPEGSDQAGVSALKRYTGYPVNKIGPLSSFHGLTIVEACQLSSQHATDAEIAEALEIMKGGVII